MEPTTDEPAKRMTRIMGALDRNADILLEMVGAGSAAFAVFVLFGWPWVLLGLGVAAIVLGVII